jgi:hypothetical protein
MTTLASTKRRICLFGLSADPPTGTGGHGGIVQTLSSLATGTDGGLDEIRVLPVYRHTYAVGNSRRGSSLCACVRACGMIQSTTAHSFFGRCCCMFQVKRTRLATYQDRLAMCRIAFAGIPHAVVANDEYQSWCRKVEEMYVGHVCRLASVCGGAGKKATRCVVVVVDVKRVPASRL